MAINHDYASADAFDEERFEVVEALYQEAELTRPKTSALARPSVIQSRKPRSAMTSVPIFTRISDLYEEAEAARVLADEAPRLSSQDDSHHMPADMPAASDSDDNDISQETAPDFAIPAFDAPAFDAPDITSHSALSDDELTAALAEDEMAAPNDIPDADIPDNDIKDDDFAIPSEFGRDEAAATPQQISAQNPLSEDDLALLADTIALDESATQDTSPKGEPLMMADDIEPAIALDDVMSQLAPDNQAPESLQDKDTDPDKDTGHDKEAKALAALDATRPQADDEMSRALADVRQAVEDAQITTSDNEIPAPSSDANEAPPQQLSDDKAPQDETNQDDEAALLAPGPALAQFIGETVRDVLDEELPQMVRGLVDEALGERQGRYGRSETPHIGLRTKPSRH
ncbi:MAG: hypothetical protein ACON49_09755 [Candidatus Puniceispirillaceae bacterium]